MAAAANFTAQKVQIKEALNNLFNVMRKYKEATTAAERKTIIEAVVSVMPNEWELYQSLSITFNI